MQATRLSPAATLLRNSKLFALPPSLAPPPAGDSSEPVARSDSATTPFPIRAAIETPLFSLNRGDWGLKRPLPLKSTTKSGTPTIRIQRGIDSEEHIADFESAADHVVTFQKWQQLNLPVRHSNAADSSFNDARAQSVFNITDDYTTNVPQDSSGVRGISSHTGVWPNVSPEAIKAATPEKIRKVEPNYWETVQYEAELKGLPIPEQTTAFRPEQPKPVKRWRYSGPWIAGMTGGQFDDFIQRNVRRKRHEFREKVKQLMRAENETTLKRQAMEDGEQVGTAHHPQAVVRPGQIDEATKEDSMDSGRLRKDDKHASEEEQLSNYIRALRQKPNVLGPLIAEYFDLPEGPSPTRALPNRKTPWDYGRTTVASKTYRELGPPKTHPSAGLSYLKTRAYADNDALRGPQDQSRPVTARILKTRRRSNTIAPSVGVAGFVVPIPGSAGGVKANTFEEFAATPGGKKMVVVPQSAQVTGEGMLDLKVNTTATYYLQDDQPIRNEERVSTDTLPNTVSGYRHGMPRLDTKYKTIDPSTQTARTGQSDNPDTLRLLDQMVGKYGGNI